MEHLVRIMENIGENEIIQIIKINEVIVAKNKESFGYDIEIIQKYVLILIISSI
jgi:hypothetical protein